MTRMQMTHVITSGQIALNLYPGALLDPGHANAGGGGPNAIWLASGIIEEIQVDPDATAGADATIEVYDAIRSDGRRWGTLASPPRPGTVISATANAFKTGYTANFKQDVVDEGAVGTVVIPAEAHISGRRWRRVLGAAGNRGHMHWNDLGLHCQDGMLVRIVSNATFVETVLSGITIGYRAIELGAHRYHLQTVKYPASISI